jgi:hypothetical protein
MSTETRKGTQGEGLNTVLETDKEGREDRHSGEVEGHTIGKRDTGRKTRRKGQRWRKKGGERAREGRGTQHGAEKGQRSREMSEQVKRDE